MKIDSLYALVFLFSSVYCGGDDDGVSLLIAALDNPCREQFLAVLSTHQGSLRCSDKAGNTILHHACKKSQKNYMGQYIKDIIDYDLTNATHESLEPLFFKKNKNGETALVCLLCSTLSCKVIEPIIDYFLMQGFNINHKNSDGRTALYYFVEFYKESILYDNEQRMLCLLKNKGVSRKIIDYKEGKGPFDISEYRQTLVDLWDGKKEVMIPVKKKPSFSDSVYSLCSIQ